MKYNWIEKYGRIKKNIDNENQNNNKGSKFD